MARSLTTENKESLLLSAFSKLIESSELQAARDEIEKKVREHFDVPIIERSREEAEALTPVEKPAKKR